jgi:hypothetical protein
MRVRWNEVGWNEDLGGVILILALGCSGPRARSDRRHKPARRQALSPVGGYTVTAETPSAKSPQRDIVIGRPGEKQEILRFPFARHVDVVWAPDESGVAVVDLVLENETRVVVFKLPGGQPVLELRREHVCELNRELPCGTAYTHVFFSNVVWLAPDRIQVDVHMVNPLERSLPPQIRGSVVVPLLE